MMTPEAKVKAKCRKVLDELGAYYFFPATHGYGQSGGFDICCSYYGHFIGVETKADSTKTPTALQTRNAKLAWESGASSLLIHNENVDKLRELLEEIKEHEGKGFNRLFIWKIDGAWISRTKR